jgi:hypothetical protein
MVRKRNIMVMSKLRTRIFLVGLLALAVVLGISMGLGDTPSKPSASGDETRVETTR